MPDPPPPPYGLESPSGVMLLVASSRLGHVELVLVGPSHQAHRFGMGPDEADEIARQLQVHAQACRDGNLPPITTKRKGKMS